MSGLVQCIAYIVTAQPNRKKKKKKSEEVRFLRPTCAPPNPSFPTMYLTILSFLYLAGHSHSCSSFLFHFHSRQHTYTHSPTGTLLITSTVFFFFPWQDHRKTLKNITPSHKLFEVKFLISFYGYYVLV